MRKELPYILLAHLKRMAFIVKEDKPFYPVNISIFCSNAEVFEANDGPYLIQEFWLGHN